jgi:hypothetical protein
VTSSTPLILFAPFSFFIYYTKLSIFIFCKLKNFVYYYRTIRCGLFVYAPRDSCKRCNALRPSHSSLPKSKHHFNLAWKLLHQTKGSGVSSELVADIISLLEQIPETVVASTLADSGHLIGILNQLVQTFLPFLSDRASVSHVVCFDAATVDQLETMETATLEQLERITAAASTPSSVDSAILDHVSTAVDQLAQLDQSIHHILQDAASPRDVILLERLACILSRFRLQLAQVLNHFRQGLTWQLYTV